jgi:hypothetical protein
VLRFVAFTVAFLVNAKMETYAGNLIGNHSRLSVTDVGKTFSRGCAWGDQRWQALQNFRNTLR